MPVKGNAMGLFSSSDIGVDLGTAYSLIYVRGKGIVLRQPSVVAVERGTGKMAALGEKAKEMLRMGVDYITTDYPLDMRTWLSEP